MEEALKLILLLAGCWLAWRAVRPHPRPQDQMPPEWLGEHSGDIAKEER